MTQKDFFDALDAPLANQRWSWGALRRDGVAFLRVWQNEVEKQDGAYFVKVTYKRNSKDQRDSAGYRERLQHVEHIRGGAAAFLIMCVAEDVTAVPRKVKQFDHENVFRGGRLRKIAGEWWIELATRLPVGEVPECRDQIGGQVTSKPPNQSLQPTAGRSDD
jgi:hypothetical protein